jgi:hypothetical protein
MTDVKDPRALHSEDVSNSDIDVTEKAGRSSLAGCHAESLNDLDDPDAGKTAEERAAIVRVAYMAMRLGFGGLTVPQDKKLVRRIDFWLIPWLCLLYLLSFLGKTPVFCSAFCSRVLLKTQSIKVFC